MQRKEQLKQTLTKNKHSVAFHEWIVLILEHRITSDYF